MVSVETKRRQNREYYARLKAYMNAHPDSPSTLAWKEKRSKDVADRFRKYIELYADEQKPIAEARKSRGWSQGQVAAMLGVSHQTVSHWEHGRMKAPWNKLYEIMPELKEVHQ